VITLKQIFRSYAIAGFAALLVALAWTSPAHAHSVGQVQTTKYFAPETVQMLRDRLIAGGGGLQAGDTVSYIIQFTPVANGGTLGAGGWITDYIPAGAAVTGAWFVQPDGLGGFTPVAPPSTALMSDGWGASGQITFNVNWTGSAVVGSATAAACTAAGFTLANCNGRMSELHADTGIFYSTDPRTAVNTYPSTDGRIRAQSPFGSGNGYNILPTSGADTGGGGATPLITLLGGDGTNWSMHNYWDAAMSNAFGSDVVVSTGTLPAFPRASNFVVMTAGRVNTPFNAASPVAGPDTGYQLDYSGNVGPWQRVYYPNSTIGKTTNGPANAIGAAVTPGAYTSSGWNLSSSNPLPANTNAIRWAAGRLSVGTNNYVKISLLLTATPSTNGLINNSEVFGGDISLEDGVATPTGSRDNPWLYSIPSVADNNSNLLILKSVVGVCSGGSLLAAQGCTPVASGSGGAVIPSGFVKLRYRLIYLNSGNGTQTSVKLKDVLPFTAAAVETIEAGNIYVISGPDIRPAVTTSGNTLSNNGAAVGAARGAAVALTSLVANTVQQTASFVTIPSLAGGGGGSLEIDVIIGDENGATATALAVGISVSNTATLSSANVAAVNSTATSYSTNTAYLTATKTTSTPSVTAGGTATYTITITNSGNAAASTIVVNDLLPYTGTVADATRRFSFVGTAGTPGTGTTYGGSTPAGTVTTTLAVPPTQSGYTANANQQHVRWAFPAGSTLAAGASFTITFSSTVGSNIPASAATYNNDVVMTYNNAGGGGAQNASATVNDTAPVTVTANLSVTKSIDCVYNTAGTVCNTYTGSGIVPSNAKVRYKLVYTNTTASPQANVYLCDQIASTQTAPAFATSISQPAIAPTPAGPFTDSPGIGAPAQIVAASATAAACGYSGANTYAYPVIASLAASATGTVYFDLTTNVTNTSTLTNTGKITNATSTATSAVAVVARDQANLVVSKTTSTPTLNVNGTATYTISITNTGNTAAGNIDVYDFLPYTGLVAAPTGRFNYVATGTTTGLTGVTPTTATPPTLTPNSGNANQQQVLWDFGAVQTLAAGATATITFTAQAGSTIASGTTVYGNDVQVRYTNGAAGTVVYTSGVSGTAPITIPIILSISKTIDCVFVGAVCTPGSYIAGAGLPVNAKIRYKLTYQNIGTATQTNVVLSDTLPTQTAAGSVSNVLLVSGTTPPTATITPASPAAGGATFSFATIPTLAAGATGVVTFDVQTTGASGNTVTNTARILSTQDPIGQTSAISAVVTNLVMTKTIVGVCTGAACTPVGPYVTGTPIPANAKLRYTISYSNPGGAAITNIRICDQLPAQIIAASATYVTAAGTTGTAPAAGLSFPANAACLLTGTNNFSYTNLIASLAAGGSGSVSFDVQTNAGAGDTVTNLGKLVTGTQIVTSTVSATVGVPNLVITKTAATSPATSPVTTYPGGLVTYTMTVSNTGNLATSTLKIYDFLPFSGSSADATKRFAFDPSLAPSFVYTNTATPGSNPTATTADAPPTVSPYSGNPNQRQVLWDFGGYALAAGGSIQITFRATAGSAMPAASYYNLGYAEFTSTSGPGSALAVTALVAVANPMPSLMFLKTVAVTSDPVNLVTNPKNIPGAEVLYTLRVMNTGPGTVTNNSISITDPLPANTELFIGDLGGTPPGPILFVQGSPTSNITWTYTSLASTTDDIDFSMNGGSTWDYTPVDPDTDGYDPAVNAIRLKPKGTMAGNIGGNPYFDLRFRMRIK